MKKILLSIILIIVVSISYGQQRINNQWALEVAYGQNILSKGYAGLIGFEKVFSSSSSLHLGLQYSSSVFRIKDTNHKFTGDNYKFIGKYGYTFYSNNIINLQYLIGAYGGYNDIRKYSKIKFKEKEELVFGLTTSFQLEFKVAKKLNIYIEPTANYDFKPKYSNLLFTVDIGIKKYF